MTEPRSPVWDGNPSIRLDRRVPHLLLASVALFVSDQDQSLSFYAGILGFAVVLDYVAPDGTRWVMVAPPDGTARLALCTPPYGSEAYQQIGKGQRVVLLTDNVEETYKMWRERGVAFDQPPHPSPWGSVITQFKDPDGNEFALIEFDEVSRKIEEQRRLAETRLEAERRAVQEMGIARQVQARLFPQTRPAARTLEYAGACFQAREVGGDYYDFLDLGRGRLGLVIADIAGKGIAASLLMANLQGNLRSQSVIAVDQPEQFLRTVNRLFYENTADADYATFFFAEYCDTTQRVRYANCGHLAPLLLRRDGGVERLGPTGTVLGMFGQWECGLEERQMQAGDLLVLYTDGVTESANDDAEEFGEARLIEAVRSCGACGLTDLIEGVVERVREFSPREQQDDVTLIVARCNEVGG